MPLQKYREKRKFTSTPEPIGKTKEPGGALHFVVHKHAARQLHYDLRLELNGVLKSWAVPKGPSMNPNDKRLAMMVEDHPYEYGDFEGIIPQGNYGAGEVIIWDRGVYSSTESVDPKESEKLLNAGLSKGHLSFLVQGDKLQGTFDLVKIPKKNENGKDNSWLLIKRPDAYAEADNILKKEESVASGRTIADLREEKKMTGERERGRPGPIPQNVIPMLANTIDEPFDDPEWIFEIKWDGYRAIAQIDRGQVKLYSRNGKFFEYREIIEDLKKIPDTAVLDGEVVALTSEGKSDFQILQNYGETKKGALLYFTFDIIYHEGEILTDLPLLERKKILRKILPSLEHVKYSDHIEKEGIKFFESAAAAGLEGIMAKNSNSHYSLGGRSKQWLKIKTYKRQDAVIGGWTEPRGGRSHLGALILGLPDKNGLRYIGHAGGRLDDRGLKEMRDRLKPFEVEKSPFSDSFKTNSPAHWIKPVLVCEVKFSNWTNDGHLRQPIFLGLREDKNPDQVFKEEAAPVENYFEPEIKEKETLKIFSKQITITNGSKVFWPESPRITKRELIDYYLEISEYILPYLKNRPESLLRHPHGIEGESFFHKNITDAPEWVKIFPFRSDTEERMINYVVCNDLPTLVYMANLGCIEINPWNSTTSRPDNPDFMVIDLDPEAVDFHFVIQAANETKKILDALQLPSYCKTSGKRGLHIYVPAGQKNNYDQIRNFCELIVRIVHEKLPKNTSLVRDPKARQGKVYLDYLQNRRGQTMSAPYSLRPVPGALVSTPLQWIEVNENLNPAVYDIKTVLKRVKTRGDVWQGFIGHKGFDLEKSLGIINEKMT